jgi:hypothetical protein
VTSHLGAACRAIPAEWGRDGQGRWTPVRWFPDPHWEVICPECGDDGGPRDLQGSEILTRRGYYDTQLEARAAANRHAVGLE